MQQESSDSRRPTNTAAIGAEITAGGDAVIEGDIVIGQVVAREDGQEAPNELSPPLVQLSGLWAAANFERGSGKRYLLRGDSRRELAAVERGFGVFYWIDGVIPFALDNALDSKTRSDTIAAISLWQRETSIRFVAASMPPPAEYLLFSNVPGLCLSPIGRQGGATVIQVHANCQIGGIAHEIGHAVGLFHEQSRMDRDAFITIGTNIIPGKEFNFAKYTSLCSLSDAGGCGSDVGAYDYGSLMHYRPTDFSANGLPVFVPNSAAYRVWQVGSSACPRHSPVPPAPTDPQPCPPPACALLVRARSLRVLARRLRTMGACPLPSASDRASASWTSSPCQPSTTLASTGPRLAAGAS